MITASDLLSTRQCTAGCLLAHAARPCTCRCAGTFHGALLTAAVQGDERTPVLTAPGPPDLSIPEVRAA